MITFDSLTLKAFIKENENFLTGARIQKIQQPTRRDFIFLIRGLDSFGKILTKRLYININPQYHHICFMEKTNEERRLIEIPQKPPMFCMLLRKYLENAKISKISQPPNERIFELYVETYNELSEKIHLCLAIELMGKHSNVVLYNDDTNVIIGCAHNVGAEKSREREMAGTLPYIYPPKQNKLDILTYEGEIDYSKLSEDFYWISKAFSKQLEGKELCKIKDYVLLKHLTPAISFDFSQYTLFSELLSGSIPQNSINDMIDNYYAFYMEKDKFQSLKSHLLTLVIQKLKKSRQSLSRMLMQLNKEQNADRYRLYGDLIMANLYNINDYVGSVELFDYENNKNISIVLDASKTAKENANQFYKLYNKSKTSKVKLEELSENIKTQIDYLEQIKFSISIAEDIKELSEIKSELLPEQNSTNEKKSANLPLEMEIDNCRVWVGKNNKQNDYIISKLSKDEDYWFHIKDSAGSHVLLRCESPSDKLIFECAKLAKEYSSAKLSTKAGVIYTKRKYIKKPPKANLGYVTYKNEKEIIV